MINPGALCYVGYLAEIADSIIPDPYFGDSGRRYVFFCWPECPVLGGRPYLIVGNTAQKRPKNIPTIRHLCSR